MAMARRRTRAAQGDLARVMPSDGPMADYARECLAVRHPSGLRTTLYVLRRVEAELSVQLHVATEQQVRSWWYRRILTVAPATARAYLSHVRAYCRWLTVAGHRDDDPSRRCRAPRATRPAHRDVSPGPVLAAVRAMPERDALAVELGLHLGLRRCEIAAVRPDEDLIDTPAGPVLRVVGKGSEPRDLPVEPVSLAGRLRRAAPRGWLLPSPRTRTGHMSPDAVGRLVAGALNRAGITATTHQLRHTAATAVAAAHGGDLNRTASWMGHASVSTTARYARPGAHDRAALASKYDAASTSEN